MLWAFFETKYNKNKELFSKNKEFSGGENRCKIKKYNFLFFYCKIIKNIKFLKIYFKLKISTNILARKVCEFLQIKKHIFLKVEWFAKKIS